MQLLEPGATFGSYTIEGFIAGGGMGEVYAARHAVYGSPVAIKVLHAELHADPSWRLRFNEEGVVGQRLKHPHVLAARELIEVDARVALVMDLVRGGQTLQKVVSREFGSGIPLVQSLQVFLGILQGVEYLHGKEVVHGDIKPENVMISGDFRDPATWVPMVTDFGTLGLIAHPVIIDGQPAVVASPRYASPEHMWGVDRLEVRSDIYSLGLLLHFLLTGRHASEARTVNEAAEIVSRPIALLHVVDQPDTLINLLRKATAVRPDDRFATCREMALAIRAALDELGVKLALEDLQADLATEVIEERRRSQTGAADATESSNNTAETEIDVRQDMATQIEPGMPVMSAPEARESDGPGIVVASETPTEPPAAPPEPAPPPATRAKTADEQMTPVPVSAASIPWADEPETPAGRTALKGWMIGLIVLALFVIVAVVVELVHG